MFVGANNLQKRDKPSALAEKRKLHHKSGSTETCIEEQRCGPLGRDQYVYSSFGWEVQLTKATRDGGYDIYGIFKDDSSDLKSHWIIECKKYREDRPVGLDIVRSLYGLGLDLRVTNVLLATTSYFARDALKYKASKYTLELRDYEGVVDWLNTYRSNLEGKLYIKDNRLILPGKT